jgi:DNA-binding phage protein
MEDDLKQAGELTDEPIAMEQDPEMWDWARTAGVSREDLLRALELSRPR